MAINRSLSVSSGRGLYIASGFANSVALSSFGQERAISLGRYFGLLRNVVADFGYNSGIAVA
jgi:hypothetical protein